MRSHPILPFHLELVSPSQTDQSSSSSNHSSSHNFCIAKFEIFVWMSNFFACMYFSFIEDGFPAQTKLYWRSLTLLNYSKSGNSWAGCGPSANRYQHWKQILPHFKHSSPHGKWRERRLYVPNSTCHVQDSQEHPTPTIDHEAYLLSRSRQMANVGCNTHPSSKVQESKNEGNLPAVFGWPHHDPDELKL
jgi:hypothetical protein